MAKLPAIRPWQPLFETRLGLQLLYCGRFRCQPDWKIESDRLPLDMIGFFFLEKNPCWSIVNGRGFTLPAGSLQVLRGGDLLRMGHDPARPITALSLSLAVQNAVVPNVLLQRKFARHYTIRNRVWYSARFDAILNALQAPLATRDWLVTAALLQFLAFLFDETNPPLLPDKSAPIGTVDRVLLAQAWASARLDQVIVLRDWARAVGWHPVHFERVFKEETGLTPIRWLEQRRLEAARQYLSGTGKSVEEIARAVGYTDPFYFSRLFRRHFGHPPARYRKLSFAIMPQASPDT